MLLKSLSYNEFYPYLFVALDVGKEPTLNGTSSCPVFLLLYQQLWFEGEGGWLRACCGTLFVK